VERAIAEVAETLTAALATGRLIDAAKSTQDVMAG
jgi:hypothetical protein